MYTSASNEWRCLIHGSLIQVDQQIIHTRNEKKNVSVVCVEIAGESKLNWTNRIDPEICVLCTFAAVTSIGGVLVLESSCTVTVVDLKLLPSLSEVSKPAPAIITVSLGRTCKCRDDTSNGHEFMLTGRVIHSRTRFWGTYSKWICFHGTSTNYNGCDLLNRC